MTYKEALGTIIFGGLLLSFAAWYIWCLHTMFFRCARPRDFFRAYYSTSPFFMLVNFMAIIACASWVLMWVAS